MEGSARLDLQLRACGCGLQEDVAVCGQGADYTPSGGMTYGDHADITPEFSHKGRASWLPS